ncbi:P-loop containing nucleoside triphosphate hydrolase protein [Nemania sp. FL0031]|nr:P-loop containing nucleoside triphosphate hydrolase protein [Nemania sp. FL0031]
MAKQLITGQQAQQAEAIDLLVRDHRSMKSLSLSHTSAEDASLPCIYLPFPANPLFHGREDMLSAIEDILKPGTSSSYVPSLALWATAGMGKTQIALEYAHRQRNRGLNAIFWIDTEHESSRIKGFTEIANLLDLEGAGSSKEHDTNRLLVLRWLQETTVPWLLIFDNVEDQRALTQIWPSGGRGAIIVTCRSELLAAATLSGRVMEVLPFSNSEGGELLLRQIGADMEDSVNKEDSMELSYLLGGHAISLNVMARSIKARKKTLGEFVKAYKENPRSLHKKQKRRIFSLPNPYYDKTDDLEYLWEIPFSELEPDEARVLGIMAMCAPSNIPITVFETKTLDIDSKSLDDILLGLRSLCLIGTNNATLYSVHRLIQGEYRHFIGIEEVKIWEETVSVLRELFPQQRKGFTLFNEWRLCESLIDHVETLALRYRELFNQRAVKYNDDFAYMIADASRYLAEIGRYNACTDLLSHGFHHCNGVESIPYTNLCAMMGQVCCERGQDRSALKYNDIVLRIRESQFGPMHSEVANALSNSALSMVGCGQDVETALSMLNRSLEIDLANPLEDHKKILHLRHFNIAFALRALGRLQEASQHIDSASAYAIAEFGENSRYLTISHRLYSDIALHESAHERAYEHATKAYAIAKLAGATTPWVAAALYYMGDIRLRQNRPQEAIYLLNQARVVSQNGEREKSDAGESARVLNKLSQAYKANKEAQRSYELQCQANEMYEQLTKTGEYTVSDDEREKWDYLVCLKFR